MFCLKADYTCKVRWSRARRAQLDTTYFSNTSPKFNPSLAFRPKCAMDLWIRGGATGLVDGNRR